MAQAIYRPITTHTGTADGLVVVDWQQSPFGLSYAVEVPGAVTTSYTIQYTLDDVDDPLVTWLPDPTNASAQTGTVGGSYTFPIRGLRVNVSALSGGTAAIRLAVLQGSSAR